MKVVPKPEAVTLNPETKTLDRTKAENIINDADKNALEMALSLRGKHGGKVNVVSMGPPLFENYLKLAIAMGADEAFLLSDRSFAGADTYPTSFTLASAIRKIGNFDLVLCGEESADASTGQVPMGIAEWLSIPQVTYVSSLEMTQDHMIRAKRTISGGYEIIEAPLPALVSVELGVNAPRFPDFKRKRWAEKEYHLSVWGVADLGISPEQVGMKGSQTTVSELVEVELPPRKREFLEGTTEEKARRLAEVLAPLVRGVGE